MSWVGDGDVQSARRRLAGTVVHALVALAVLAGAVLALAGLARPDESAGEQAAETTGTPHPSDPAALALLRRASRVARSRSWTGSQVVSSTGTGAMTARVQVRHVALTGSTLVVSAAGGAARTVYETDDDDLGSSPLAAPYAIGAGEQWEELIEASYAVRRAGTGEVAGEVTDTVALTRPDGTVAARIDIGRSSGLPLQRRLYDADGTLTRQTVFTSVALVDPGRRTLAAAPAAPSPAAPAAPSPAAPAQTVPPVADDDETPVDAAGQARLRAEGYSLPPTLGPGLSLVDTRDGTGTTGPVPAGTVAGDLDLTYSDGLLALAVHEQRGRLDPAGLGAGWATAQRGGVSVLVGAGDTRTSWADEGLVYTVVGDVSDDVVDEVVAGLPHRQPTMAFTRRLRRGADRVGSWLDPFQ